MRDHQRCCRDLPALEPAGSPFVEAIAFSFHDGPEDGWVRCGGCGREFRFKLIDSIEDQRVRIYGLSPIAEGSLADFAHAMARFQVPNWPNWVPLWRFPTEADRVEIEGRVERVEAGAGPVELIVAATTWPTEKILAAQFATADDPSEQDRFSVLGLVRPTTPD